MIIVSRCLKMKLVGVIFFVAISCGVIRATQAQTQGCGRQQKPFGVFGGMSASKIEWTWVVAFIKLPEQQFFCAGSLISERHVLSGQQK